MSFTWQTIKKPIVALAPMSGVSDIAMRSIARRWGSDLTFSEFISSDAIFYKVKSWMGSHHVGSQSSPLPLEEEEILRCARDEQFWEDDKSCLLAKFIEEERPFIIQLFGPEPEHFRVAATVLNERFHPDGFDINFGCPARSVINNGAGGCLFLDPKRAQEIIRAVKQASGNLPTSIKLRASYKHISALEFLEAIQGAPFENVTVHMRTYEQVHTGEPNVDAGRAIAAWCHDRNLSCVVNGGIGSGEKAKNILAYTGADGVMVAQASLGNPFIFAEIKHALGQGDLENADFEKKMETVLEHCRLMLEHKGSRGMIEMRKHLVWYFRGFPNASEVRKKLTQVERIDQVQQVLTEHSLAFGG